MKKEIKYQINENECWICMSHYPAGEYPRIKINKKLLLISRIVLEQKLGRKIKQGYLACHECNNSRCINPKHIYEGTPKQNTEDSIKIGTHVCLNQKGESAAWHKLSNNDILKIRKSKIPSKKLSEIYGVCLAHIYRIKNRQEWSHI